MQYGEYDEETLYILHEIELEILRDFLYICKKYDLTYFGFAGTAIGALRHKGFIPWDDDIDVCMPRRDYNKFIKAAKKEFPDKYTVMNAEENEAFPLTTTRWMLKGTAFREESLKDVDCELGIFLDIYPFDNVADYEPSYKKQAFDAWVCSKILILLSVPEPVLAFDGLKACVIKAVCRAAHWVLNAMHISKRGVYLRCKLAMTRYNKVHTKRISYLCSTDRYCHTVALEDLYPLRQEPFEGLMLNFPANVEKMLSQMHPDFMTLPPEDKRKNHYPYELDFGIYGSKYNK